MPRRPIPARGSSFARSSCQRTRAQECGEKRQPRAAERTRRQRRARSRPEAKTCCSIRLRLRASLRSNACTRTTSFRGPASASPQSSGSPCATVAASGPRAPLATERRSALLWGRPQRTHDERPPHPARRRQPGRRDPHDPRAQEGEHRERYRRRPRRSRSSRLPLLPRYPCRSKT